MPSPRLFDRANADPRLKHGLVGWWLGGGSGLTWFDQSGYGNHGALTGGPTWTLGQGGKRSALSFDGTDDHVSMGNVLSFDGATPMTLAAWIRTSTALLNAVQSIVFKEDHNPNYQGYGYYVLPVTGTLEFDCINSYPGDALIVKGDVSVADTLWHHAVVTYDGSKSSAGVKIYTDAKLNTNSVVADTLTGSPANTKPFCIGADNAAAHFFPGQIDDVRIYNRALSLAEVSLLAMPSFLPLLGRRPILAADVAPAVSLDMWQVSQPLRPREPFEVVSY